MAVSQEDIRRKDSILTQPPPNEKLLDEKQRFLLCLQGGNFSTPLLEHHLHVEHCAHTACTHMLCANTPSDNAFFVL